MGGLKPAAVPLLCGPAGRLDHGERGHHGAPLGLVVALTEGGDAAKPDGGGVGWASATRAWTLND